jgi:DNA-binding beta-propeller fold protein YncE
MTAPDQTFGYVYHYDGNGALTLLSSGIFSVLADARSVLLSPDGSRLYLASSATGAVQCYAIGADGIPVAKGASVIAGADPVGMTFDPDGKYLYVLNRGDDGTADSSTISGYSAAENCSLTTILGMPISAGSMDTVIGVARFTP